MAVTLYSIVLFPSIIRAWTPSFANLSPCLVCFDKGGKQGVPSIQMHRPRRVRVDDDYMRYRRCLEYRYRLDDFTGRRSRFRSLDESLSDNMIKQYGVPLLLPLSMMMSVWK